ncbi:MAG: ribosome biogenesis GTPase YlqF [Firmicutes bacterium]|nr:ribosome biogenesis GTPase YlqF [Bacillota bacterium]
MGKGSKEKLTNLNWYPGHMKKTREMIQENLRLVDAVIEVADARIPVSSRNPIIDDLVKGKERVILLNKADLADDDQTAGWIDLFRKKGKYAVSVNSSTGTGINNLIRRLEKIQEQRDAEKARKRPLRLMVAGVPNAGKSSLINKLTGRKSAKTGDRPGVTRGKQWLTINNGMQLLDTPGILWPKFEDVRVGINLAFCGSIKDEILDIETLCLEFIKVILKDYKELLVARYKVEELSGDALEAMEQIAIKRGFIFPGKRIDYERTARTVLDEFRAGKIGRITLERCGEE